MSSQVFYLLIGLSTVLLLNFIFNRIAKARLRKAELKLRNNWSILASTLGLSFDSSLCVVPKAGMFIEDCIQGVYRGYQISMGLSTSYGDSDLNLSPQIYSILTVEVENRSNFSLDIHRRNFLDKQTGLTFGHENLDQKYSFYGKTSGFVGRVRDLILSQKSELFMGHEKVMMKTHPGIGFPLLSDVMPTIELEGRELKIIQRGVVEELPDQLEMVDCLCELAALIEEVNETKKPVMEVESTNQEKIVRNESRLIIDKDQPPGTGSAKPDSRAAAIAKLEKEWSAGLKKQIR